MHGFVSLIGDISQVTTFSWDCVCAQQCLSLVIYGMIMTFLDEQFGQCI